MARPEILRKLLIAGFFLSGIASMIYEVVWFRELSLVIGTTVYAFSAMLTSFLAGLSLGSYVTSRRADVHGNVIRLFALLEVGIGLYGLVSLPLFRAIGLPYAHLFALFQNNIYAIALCQFVMSFFVMIVPTAMLGGLFPLASKACASDFDRLGGAVGSLYAANSWGCVLGARLGLHPHAHHRHCRHLRPGRGAQHPGGGRHPGGGEEVPWLTSARDACCCSPSACPVWRP